MPPYDRFWRDIHEILLVQQFRENWKILWNYSGMQIMFIYSEKATKFEEISLLVLTLLNNTKTKEISPNFCGLLRKPQLYQFLKNILTHFTFFKVK